MEGDKQYSIEMEFHDPFLHVIVGGLKVTPQVALEYWREIIEECERLGCRRILLEHNFIEMIPMREMLEIIGPVAEMLKGRMLAFYDRYGNYETPEAGKKILRSQEVKMQIFHNLTDAERWLLANQPSQ